MSSNYPPGVDNNLIPGNRPEDIWFETNVVFLAEQFWENGITAEMILEDLEEGCFPIDYVQSEFSGWRREIGVESGDPAPEEPALAWIQARWNSWSQRLIPLLVAGQWWPEQFHDFISDIWRDHHTIDSGN